MKIFIRFAALGLFLFAHTTLFSQNISKYLDDGRIAGCRNILSIGYDPLSRELPVSFEHWVVSRFSIVLGGGPISIARQSWLIPDEPLTMKQSGIGLSAFIKAKVYFGKFPERAYITMYPRFNLMDHKVFTDAAILNFGYQRLIVNKILLGAEAGFGFRFYHDESWAFQEGDSDLSWQPHFPLTVNISYLF
jgi:hypothetical protein